MLPAPIYIAGHRGLVGSALCRCFAAAGYGDLVTRTHAELDLTDQQAVDRFFSETQPRIMANNTYPASFIYDNLMIEANLIHAAHRHDADRLLFLGSSCIYPKHAPQPMPESALLTGTLEPTNEPYALAKIAGIKLCESYNRQYDTDYRSLMPTNLYGPDDNFDLDTSHVLPALIRKLHLARCLETDDWPQLCQDLDRNPVRGVSGSASDSEIRTLLADYGIRAEAVTLWGSGGVKREFLHVDDLASACLHVLSLPRETYREHTQPMLSHINVGTGEDLSIRELAELIRRIVGYTGPLHWDTAKPDGTPRKLLDITLLQRLGWHPTTDLPTGIQAVYRHYRGL
jgi:GDP-L-fucose synthase